MEPPPQEDRGAQHRHDERRPLRPGEWAEALVDAEGVLEQAEAAVEQAEREGEHALAARALLEVPEEGEEQADEDHVVERGLVDADALGEDRALRVEQR